jgi:hypothetical protein
MPMRGKLGSWYRPERVRHLKIWLDDLRDPPSLQWDWCKSVDQAIETLSRAKEYGHQFTHLSLDHDLGDFVYEGGNAPNFLDRLVENENWPTIMIAIHSANPVGVANMCRTIERYGPYEFKKIYGARVVYVNDYRDFPR